MCAMSGKGGIAAIEAFHIWRVEHDAVHLAVTVGKLATVGACLDVRRKKLVLVSGNLFPEYSFAESHVGNSCAAWDVES